MVADGHMGTRGGLPDVNYGLPDCLLVSMRRTDGPGGKPRGLCSRLWTRISGRCLRSRGVRFSAPAVLAHFW